MIFGCDTEHITQTKKNSPALQKANKIIVAKKKDFDLKKAWQAITENEIAILNELIESGLVIRMSTGSATMSSLVR